MPEAVFVRLREDIVGTIEGYGSFTTDVEEDEKARAAGFNGNMRAGHISESYICKNGSIYVMIQYMGGRHNGMQRIDFKAGEPQREYNFAIRVCLYDDDFLPDVSPFQRVANKVELAQNLYKPETDFQNNGRVYQLGNLNVFKKRVGHVVNLDIVYKGVAWRVEENQADRQSFIGAISTAANALMPVANRYVNYRNDLFRRK